MLYPPMIKIGTSLTRVADGFPSAREGNESVGRSSNGLKLLQVRRNDSRNFKRKEREFRLKVLRVLSCFVLKPLRAS